MRLTTLLTLNLLTFNVPALRLQGIAAGAAPAAPVAVASAAGPAADARVR